MPIRLTVVESLLGHLLPLPLLDTPLAPGLAKVIVTACELGLFDALGEKEEYLHILAERLECAPHGLQLLMQILVTTGYLRYQRGRYANTRLTRRWLVSSSPFNLTPYLLHSPDVVTIWEQLPAVVRSGKQVMSMPYEEDASQPEMKLLLARHYAGLASLAMALGGEIIQRIRVSAQADALLDVGGSHAAFSALLCQRHPHVRATILDLEPGLEAGRRTAKQQHLEERMSFVESDIVREDFTQVLDSRFDLAFYFHIAHLLQPGLNQAVLRKVIACLKPGGQLIFVDQIVDQKPWTRSGALMVQFMELTMLTVGGTCYSFATIKDWLEGLGMEQIQKHWLLTPGVSMISAVKRYSNSWSRLEPGNTGSKE
ncbi:class I SAM-dependent methyltransferase [Tengunoibacter tsumagoiensis]|uniref:O-methyltransferase n=1 Tax=Tengunoibacter tsumagoiensis TaxID=2014871 RepID=A0A402A5J5_9CHLR|nr:class I SAM-dependent methyltransferase [Tengunoibacter tsumagoiensis]GCE14349.1 hypothetical protein KTT_42080 [Tengunoibacter tsumagoiensis]